MRFIFLQDGRTKRVPQKGMQSAFQAEMKGRLQNFHFHHEIAVRRRSCELYGGVTYEPHVGASSFRRSYDTRLIYGQQLSTAL